MPDFVVIVQNEMAVRESMRYDPESATYGISALVDGEGDPVVLTPMERDLLVYLACRPGRVISREELLRNAWGHDFFGHTHTVAVQIGWLRAKLGDRGWLIQTVAGIGYRFASPHGARRRATPATGR